MIKKKTTAEEAAKKLIRGYVKRGDSLQSLRKSGFGSFSDDYGAQIGGYVNGKNIGPKKIAVIFINKKKLKPSEIFSLEEVFNSIKAEND